MAGERLGRGDAFTVIVPSLPGFAFSPQRCSLTEQTREGGYQHEQSTRPLTLSPGLADSPAGLLAWTLEKYRAWSDGEGIPFSDDFLLTQASLSWFTDTISTSFRPYYEYAQGLTRRVERVDVPTAVALFPADLSHPPRSWAERIYNVTRCTRMPRGGHFAAREESALLADDITSFFRDHRPGHVSESIGRAGSGGVRAGSHRPDGNAQRPEPPVASIVLPVTQRASSEARNATMSATSSGRPTRPRAASDAAWASASGLPRSQPAFTSVSMIPGATEFAVMPRAPSSFARLRVKLSRALLVAP